MSNNTLESITAEQMAVMYQTIVNNLKQAQYLLGTVSNRLAEVHENGAATRVDCALELLMLTEQPIQIFHKTMMELANHDPKRPVKSELVKVANELYNR